MFVCVLVYMQYFLLLFFSRNREGVLTVNEVVDLLHQDDGVDSPVDDSDEDPDYKRGMIKKTI